MTMSARNIDEIARRLEAQGRHEDASALREAVVSYFADVEAELGRPRYEPDGREVAKMAEQMWEMHLRDEHASTRESPAPEDMWSHAMRGYISDDASEHVINEMCLLMERWAVLGAKDSERLVQIILNKLFGSDVFTHWKWSENRINTTRSVTRNPDTSANHILEFTDSLRSVLKMIAPQPFTSDIPTLNRAAHVRSITDQIRGKGWTGDETSELRKLTTHSAEFALYSGFGRSVGEWLQPWKDQAIKEESEEYLESIKDDAIDEEITQFTDRVREELESRDEEAGSTLGLGEGLLQSWWSGEFAPIVTEGNHQFVQPNCPAYGVDIDLINRLLSQIYGDHAQLNPFRDVLAAAGQGRGKVAELVQKAGIR
jgi:hypothetical protein